MDQNEQTQMDHEQEMQAQQDGGQVSTLQAELQACEVARDGWKDKFMHVSADLQNYRRRMEREQLEWRQQAQSDVVMHMLPIVDDFDRAMVSLHQREHAVAFDEWLKGFELISKALQKFLDQMHIAEIKEMTVFDPMLHEAIAQVPSAQHSSGQIVEVIQKGYMFNGRVLRPAKVTVAQ